MPDESAPPPLAVVILGTDAVRAAAPASPVQLAHACLAAGYAAVVPASWGDELIAGECLRRAGARAREPLVCAMCPLVTDRLLASGPEIAPFTISLVSPPVATARYLRASCGEGRLRLTYVGTCPGAEDESLDERITPPEFLAMLAGRGIVPAEQPQVFDSIIPADRRRFQSQPGGVPTAEALWTAGGRTLIEVDDDDFITDVAQRLVTREHALIDIAPMLGCACSGAAADVPARGARIAAAAMEPPRSTTPVIDTTVAIDLVRPLPATARHRERAVAPPPAVAAPLPAVAPRRDPRSRAGGAAPGPRGEAQRREVPMGEAPPVERMAAADPGALRRRGAGSATVRPVGGGLPTVNSGEGRALPRAYVGRRRTGRTPADNEAIRPGTRPPRAADHEWPIRASVEPSQAILARPGTAALQPAQGAAWTAAAREAFDELARRPRHLALLLGVIVVVSVLVGIAAGRMLVGGGERTPPSADVGAGGGPEGARTLIGDPTESLTIERSGSVGPPLRAEPAAPRAGRTVQPAQPRQAVPGARREPVPPAAMPVPPSGQVGAARPVPADSTRGQPPSPTAQAPAVTRQSALDRELQAIARELELRRARLDSLARRESLGARPRP